MRAERGSIDPWRQSAVELVTMTASLVVAFVLAPPTQHEDPPRLIVAMAGMLLVGGLVYPLASRVITQHQADWREVFRRTRSDEWPAAIVGLVVTMFALIGATVATAGDTPFTSFVIAYYCGAVVRSLVYAATRW